MKIAVACMGTQVAPHFGHCEHFCLYTMENGAVAESKQVENPPHEHGFLPGYLADLGAEIIIAGCMGTGAVERFRSRGVDVITGAQGEAADAAVRYAKGELKTTGAVCQHHHGDGENEHSCHHHGEDGHSCHHHVE